MAVRKLAAIQSVSNVVISAQVHRHGFTIAYIVLMSCRAASAACEFAIVVQWPYADGRLSQWPSGSLRLRLWLLRLLLRLLSSNGLGFSNFCLQGFYEKICATNWDCKRLQHTRLAARG